MKMWTVLLLSFCLFGVLFYFYHSSKTEPSTPSHEAVINGAGATFPYPLYAKWFSEYHKANQNVRINYQSVGSGGGIRLLLGQKVDFAASDISMTDEQLKQAPNKILHIPTAIGAIVLAYKLPDLSGELRLDADLIAEIFLGKITSWDDAKIQALNSSLKLPKIPIMVVHRSDGSGTTAIFSSYLAKLSPEWNKNVGHGASLNWPVGLGAKGNEGIAGLVKQHPGSIGYIEWVYAEQNKLSFASLKNKSGDFINPSSGSLTASMEGLHIPDDFRTSIIDSDNKTAYPLCGLTYLLVFQNMSGEKGKKFTNFLQWSLMEGQQHIEPLKYAPLPTDILKRVGESISLITKP
jgi:phosphate transport system substrate-binding protein